jgi:hypothetical protein
MKLLLLTVFLFGLCLIGCVSDPEHECHSEDVTCPLGTQKECRKPTDRSCNICECHSMDQSPFSPMQNNSVRGGENGDDETPGTNRHPQDVKQDSPRP